MKASHWAEIHRLYDREHLSQRAIARQLRCSRKTVKNGLEQEQPPSSLPPRRGSILDPHLVRIDALIDKTPDLSAVRVLEEIRKKGYHGELTLIRNYLRRIRPARGRIYTEVDYEPAEAMQIDWGECGVLQIGDTRRKVSVFVAVLCYSRLLYIEFSLSQKKPHFYRCLVNAFEFFGAVTVRLILDNLKTAVFDGSGANAVLQTEFRELCGYYRIKPWLCERQDPESKGGVEVGVRYVKQNALAGREFSCFQDYQDLALYWMTEVANVREHRTTGEKPIVLFEKEKELLRALPAVPYDTDEIINAIATPHARVRLDTNHYSVPPAYARKQVTLRADAQNLRVLHCGEEIASHDRSYERRKRIVDPDHLRAALARRKRGQTRQTEVDFDSLGTEAVAFRKGLLSTPVKPIVHLRRIMRFVALYGNTEVLAALALACEYQTYDAAYVSNIIEQERRKRQLPSPTPLAPKRADLIDDIHVEPPDPADYDYLLD